VPRKETAFLRAMAAASAVAALEDETGVQTSCVVETRPRRTTELPWFSAYLSGSVAGLASGVVGHPLDTLKLRVQMNPHVNAAGVSLASLFRGLGPALGVQLVQSALLFGTYDRLRAAWHEFGGGTRSSTTTTAVVAGAATGALIAPATSYLEALKCRAQTLGTCVAPPSVTVGLLATVLRCGAGNAAYFAVWEALSSSSDNTDASSVVVAGTAAGVAYWTVALPFDVVKSHQQVGNGALSVRATVASLPARALVRGWLPAVCRAAPMSAACFAAFEAAQSAQAALLQRRGQHRRWGQEPQPREQQKHHAAGLRRTQTSVR